jgi:hypothetical protein
MKNLTAMQEMYDFPFCIRAIKLAAVMTEAYTSISYRQSFSTFFSQN